MQLRAPRWTMEPLLVREVRSAFFGEPHRFPPGSLTFDGALLMRGIPHEWHALSETPEPALAASLG